jgi:predicted negative regulator of RcsB-dependent stress response
MKATERHQLKQNEFANTTARVVGSLQEHRSRVGVFVIAGVLVVAIAGGFVYWRKVQADTAGAALGVAIATAQSPVAPASTLPGTSQAAGTFPSERARAEAAIAAFGDVATRYPGTASGTAATYQLASELLNAGQADQAEQHFKTVVDSGTVPYAAMARLGVAQAQEAAGKVDQAVATLTELAAIRDGLVPVDAVLMELGRTQQKAGKIVEARAAFKRVTDEFPSSTYLSEAQTKLAALE